MLRSSVENSVLCTLPQEFTRETEGTHSFQQEGYIQKPTYRSNNKEKRRSNILHVGKEETEWSCNHRCLSTIDGIYSVETTSEGLKKLVKL